jgi:hypothetical protein
MEAEVVVVVAKMLHNRRDLVVQVAAVTGLNPNQIKPAAARQILVVAAVLPWQLLVATVLHMQMVAPVERELLYLHSDLLNYEF